MHNQKVTNLGVRKLQLLKDYDGVYNWLQLWGRGSERPKAQTQQKLTQIPSPPPPDFCFFLGGIQTFLCILTNFFSLI